MFKQTRVFAAVRSATWKASLVSIALSLLLFNIALAASGDLDTTFSGDGKVTTDIRGAGEDTFNEIALQADGKIVVAGNWDAPVRPRDFALLRYKRDGSLDTTFSGDGELLTNFGGIDSAEDVEVQKNGKIIVAGMRCFTDSVSDPKCDVALARYQPNGTLDRTFSGDGKVLTDFGGDANGFWGGLAIQLDGKIVVNGWMWNGTDFDFAILRYQQNGDLDSSFGGDGKVSFGFSTGRMDWANGLILQADGKILSSGFSCDNLGFENCDIVVVRLNANGTLDTSFSGDGRQRIDLGSNDFSDSIAVQSNGKVLLAGTKISPTSESCAVVRLNPNGNLDKTFSGDGKVVTSFGPGVSSGCSDVRVQANGKIVVVGRAGGDFALVRYNSNGSLDKTFSTDGKVRIDFGTGDDFGLKFVIQSNGSYVVAGSSQGDFALARVLP